MINPLSIATRGRITKSAKRTLTLAVIGWLFFTGSPTPPPHPVGPVAGGGFRIEEDGYKDYRILIDDNEIFYIIQMWLQVQC